MYKNLVRLLGFWIILTACDRYNPVDDQIYTIPSEDNLLAVESFKALKDAIENYPQDAENYYKLSLYYLQKKEDTLALRQIQKAIQLDSLEKKYFFVLAHTFQKLKKNEDALKAVLKLQSDDDKNLEALILRGELYFKQREYDESIRELNKALKIAPKDHRIYYWKGNVESARYDSANALKNFRVALQLKPQYVEVYGSLAELFNKYELYNTAIRYAKQGLEYDAQNAFLNFQKAESFRRKVYFDDSATVYYQRTLNQDESYFMASYYLGRYAFGKARYKEAQKYFETALKFEDKLANAHYYLGVCLKYTGKREEALVSLEKAIQLDNKNLAAKDMYWAVKTEINQAKILAREDSLRRAYYKWLEEQSRKQLQGQ